PRRLRHVPRDAGDQSAASWNSGDLRCRQAALGRAGRLGRGRDRDPADHEPDAHVRPSARRRRARGTLLARHSREARELGRLGMPQTIVPSSPYEAAPAALAWLPRAFGFRDNEAARDAGAHILRDLADVEAAGSRLYSAEDLEGHRWMFAQR